jgi:myosin heavy subunit
VFVWLFGCLVVCLFACFVSFRSNLPSHTQYNYLANGDLLITDVNDSANYDALKQSLRQLEFTEQQIDSVFKILSGILLLGNLEFGSKHTGRPTLDNKAEV